MTMNSCPYIYFQDSRCVLSRFFDFKKSADAVRCHSPQNVSKKKKKKEPSLYFCIWTKKMPLNNVVMFIFLYLLPKNFDGKFWPQIAVFWILWVTDLQTLHKNP